MIESIWDMLLKVHSGCPGNIFFSKLNICKGSRPACNNIQIHEKWELKRQMFSSAVCSLSPSAPKPLLQLQSPLPTDPNGKIQSRLTFYNRFTNPLKVPDLALPLFLVHHKNKCTEKPLRSSLCWRTSFPYFFFFFFWFSFYLLLLLMELLFWGQLHACPLETPAIDHILTWLGAFYVRGINGIVVSIH